MVLSMIVDVKPICDCLEVATSFWQESPDSAYAKITVTSLQKMIKFLSGVAQKNLITPRHKHQIREMIGQMRTIIQPRSIFRTNNPTPIQVKKINAIEELLEEAEIALEKLTINRDR